MLTERLLVALAIIPFGVGFALIGGWPYTIAVAVILGVAAWEFQSIFRRGGYQPAVSVLIPGVVILTLARGAWGFERQELLWTLLAIVALGIHTLQFERGLERAGTNFAITIAGLLYIGWLGSYLVSLRHIPNGLWWVLTAIPAVGLADAGAYFVGGRFGRHLMAPRTSPGKTWEGYIGGIVVGSLSGLILAALWHLREPAILPLHGLIIGLVVTVVAPLGDLGESLFKRQFDVKDASHILPGHGGIMDRIDTWIYAAVISYYLIQALW